MPLDVMPSGKYGYISESPLLMAVLDVTPSTSVKEVDFLCGMAMWYGIDGKLECAGYTLTNTGNATLGNGDVVLQKSYTKGTTICLVQTIDRDVKQVIFKRQAAKPRTKRKK